MGKEETKLKALAYENRKEFRKGKSSEQKTLNLLSLFYFEFVRHPKIDEKGKLIRPTDDEMIQFLRTYKKLKL